MSLQLVSNNNHLEKTMNASSTLIRALPRLQSQPKGDKSPNACSKTGGQQNRQSDDDQLFEARLRWFLALSSVE
jgi:hypothetical protein